MGFLPRTHWCKRSKFLGSFNGVCVLVLLVVASYKEGLLRNPLSNHSQKSSSGYDDSILRKKIIQSTINPSTYNAISNGSNLESNRNLRICTGVHHHEGYDSKCDYLRSNPDCSSGGLFNYLVFFYCDCEKYKPVGYVVLAVLLVCFLYLLGNTASDYFCSSLEKLSSLLKFPPTVSGVTLLPLGNGAPDVFAGIAAFVGKDSGDVGLNSVLGAAIFVTCIVVGTVSFLVADKNIQIDKKCFLRDVGFFLVALVALGIMLAVGEVNVGGAVAFVSIYVIYGLCVTANEILRKHGRRLKLNLCSVMPLLPVTGRILSGEIEDEAECIPLLQPDSVDGVPDLPEKSVHMVWDTNVGIHSKEAEGETPKLLWGWNEDDKGSSDHSSCSCSRLCLVLELPLVIPRRLTIPIVDNDRWSKPCAVASAFFAPILLSFLWNSQDISTPATTEFSYISGVGVGVGVGIILGLVALASTRNDHPPHRFLLAWVLGGFFMSIVWFYILANELVALLVSFGVILQINPSLLALTILAWGNSTGDLMSNVSIATGGGHGVQIAISGCYAGPMFNTLIGLGISFLLGAWSKRPSSYSIPCDSSLYSTLGLLMLALVWAVIVLLWNGMRPSRVLGVGLVVIYAGFLTLRATVALGDGSLGKKNGKWKLNH